jgi:hypothetical protein
MVHIILAHPGQRDGRTFNRDLSSASRAYTAAALVHELLEARDEQAKGFKESLVRFVARRPAKHSARTRVAGRFEFDAGMPRPEAEAQAFEACIVEWLNRNPTPSQRPVGVVDEQMWLTLQTRGFDTINAMEFGSKLSGDPAPGTNSNNIGKKRQRERTNIPIRRRWLACPLTRDERSA